MASSAVTSAATAADGPSAESGKELPKEASAEPSKAAGEEGSTDAVAQAAAKDPPA